MTCHRPVAQANVQNSQSDSPEGNDVLKFAIDLPNRISGQLNGGTACAKSTIKDFLGQLFHYLAIEYNDFKLSAKHEELLLDILHDQEAKGLVSSSPIREKQWVSSLLISSLNSVQLMDAIKNGTTSWDVVIAKCLSLSMMTATGARAGDLAVSHGYTDEASTRLSDMVIKISKSDDAQVVFRSRLTLRFVKGHKNNNSKNHVVALDSTLDPKHNSLDPVKLLLALALRTGAVKATSIDQLITDTLARSDRTVQWAHPEWPLHPQFYAHGSGVKPDRPAFVLQFTNSLQAAAATAGIDVKLRAHDIRRGAARDASKLPSTSTQGLEGARVLLAHSHGSMLSGVTEEYVGPSTTSSWEQRRLVEPDRDFDLRIDEDLTGLSQRRKRIDSLEPFPGQSMKRGKITMNPSPGDYADTDLDPVVGHDTSLADVFDWDADTALVNEFEFPDMQTDTCFKETVAANIKSLGLTIDIDLGNPKDKRGTTDALTELQAESAARGSDKTSKSNSIDWLGFSSLDFLRQLSTINITTKLGDQTLDEGNSRDPSSSFMYKCGVDIDCSFEHQNIAHLRIHEAGCTPEKVATVHYKQKSTEHSCTTCSYVASGRNPAANLAAHIQKNHNFSQRCDFDGCIDQTLYTSADRLRDHRDHHVYDYSKFCCPIDECTRKSKPLATVQSFRTHLAGMHGMSAAVAAEWIQKAKW